MSSFLTGKRPMAAWSEGSLLQQANRIEEQDLQNTFKDLNDPGKPSGKLTLKLAVALIQP